MKYTELMENKTSFVDEDEYCESALNAMAQEPMDENEYRYYALSPQIQSAADLAPTSPDFGPAASAASLDTALQFFRTVELFERGLSEAINKGTYPYIAGLGSSLRYSARYYPFYWSMSMDEKENIASECVCDLAKRIYDLGNLYQDFLCRRLKVERKSGFLPLMDRVTKATLARKKTAYLKDLMCVSDNVVQTDDGEVSLFDLMSTTENIASSYEKKETFYETLVHLNPDDRKLFDLLSVGRPKNQIAKELKRSPGYVTKHAKKIRKAFAAAGLL